MLQGPLAVGGQVPELLAAMECALPALNILTFDGTGDLMHEPTVVQEVEALLIFRDLPQIYLCYVGRVIVLPVYHIYIALMIN